MSHLIKLVAVISLLYLIPAQASVNVGAGMSIKECAIFADEATGDGSVDETKKESGEKPKGDNDEEEEEPDCD